MNEEVSKMIVLPQDGSAFAQKSLDYLNLMFGPQHNLNPVLMYVLPSLPLALIEEGRKKREIASSLKKINQRNEAFAENILGSAKETLVGYNFSPDRIKKVCQSPKLDIARDIVNWAHDKMADGVLLNCHGRSRVEAFFMGEVSLKLLEYSGNCPVWLLRGTVKDRNVLVAVDNSESALKAIDYAGFMLNGTESRIILFHTKRSLRRFLPKAIFEDIPGIAELWSEKAAEEIAPVMEKAKQMLTSAGIEENRIQVEIAEGSRNPAKDVLAAAGKNECGTIILGRQGDSNNKEFTMGSTARKVIEAASGMAIWVV
ncbi:MAG: universal stress protein [Desulfobacteraceae bacterium]|nr:universal stress protein [Desulfobacteraceae bacterium]MBC2757588.1 universal stress protein [Desulfobacteraceae bacterium]